MDAYAHSASPSNQNLSINIRTATPPCSDTQIAWYAPAQPAPLSPITDGGSSSSEGPTYSPVDSLAPTMPTVSFAPTPNYLSPPSRQPTTSGRRNRSVSDPPPCSPQDTYPSLSPMGRARASTVTTRIPFPQPHLPVPDMMPSVGNVPYTPAPYVHLQPPSYQSMHQQPGAMPYGNLGGLYYPVEQDTMTHYSGSSAMASRTGLTPATYGMMPRNDAIAPGFDAYPYPNIAAPAPLPSWNTAALPSLAAPHVSLAGSPANEHDADAVAQTATWLSNFDLSSRSSSASSLRQPAGGAHGYIQPATYAGSTPPSSRLGRPHELASYAGVAPSSSSLPGRPQEHLPYTGGASSSSALTRPSGSRGGRRQIGTEAMTRKSDERRKQDARFHCTQPGCLKSFTRSHNLRNHLRSHEQKKAFPCSMCPLRFNNPGVRDYHKRRCRGSGSEVE
ncbi:hypothetical protein BD626DRAFT_254017 [Schizophyllum amplum]|uniref:C2H2-type domain-containing protein n=1 Tax=Schizophyllum amplum TaxID=97359 RepID=A0A550CI99_9AGAR|nr:hypothetical protein BD626DRAFT_254017 [Auriculariopsis ampla]